MVDLLSGPYIANHRITILKPYGYSIVKKCRWRPLGDSICDAILFLCLGTSSRQTSRLFSRIYFVWWIICVGNLYHCDGNSLETPYKEGNYAYFALFLIYGPFYQPKCAKCQYLKYNFRIVFYKSPTDLTAINLNEMFTNHHECFCINLNYTQNSIFSKILIV